MAKKKASGKRTPVAKAASTKKKAVKGRRVTVAGVTREEGRKQKYVAETRDGKVIRKQVDGKKAFLVGRKYEGPKLAKGQKAPEMPKDERGKPRFTPMSRKSMTAVVATGEKEKDAAKKARDRDLKTRRRKDNSQAGQKTKATVRGGKGAKSAAKKGREVQRAVKKAVKKTSDNAKTRQRTPSSKKQTTTTKKKVARKAAKK